MKNGVQLYLEDEGLVELMRVLVDEDAEGSLFVRPDQPRESRPTQYLLW